MENKKWKEFEKLTGKCYMSMAGLGESRENWDKAYEMLKQILTEERKKQPDYGAELYLLDEITDYGYDVDGWLEDYLDEVEMRDDGEQMIAVCDELTGLFRWEEQRPSNIMFLKASALRQLGRNEESAEYCGKWVADEPDNPVAVAADIYALLSIQDWDAGERLIKQHIQEDTRCTDANEVIFTAAAKFYEESGDKKKWKHIDKELDAYDEELGKYLSGMDADDEDDFAFF